MGVGSFTGEFPGYPILLSSSLLPLPPTLLLLLPEVKTGADGKVGSLVLGVIIISLYLRIGVAYIEI